MHDLSQDPPLSTTVPRRSGGRILGWAAGLVAVAAAAAIVLAGRGSHAHAAAAAAPPPVPVKMGKVAIEDFPIYRQGVGTVQAYNTVTVKVRVDGEVQKVAFREGQDVKQGDLLVQIDPRPFEAQLRLAQADAARDRALLGNAKLDLERYST